MSTVPSALKTRDIRMLFIKCATERATRGLISRVHGIGGRTECEAPRSAQVAQHQRIRLG
jgi:hypothetical protein